jgi:hypothetical protein
MTAFDRALTGLAVPADRRSPESPVYWFNEGLIASKQGDCLLRCGKPGEAAASCQKALQLFDNSFVRDFAFCTLHLSVAHLQSGEIKEAARVIGDGTVLAARVHSIRLTKEVRALRAGWSRGGIRRRFGTWMSGWRGWDWGVRMQIWRGYDF